MKKNPIVLLHGLFGAPLGLEEIAQGLRRAGYEVMVPAVPPFAGTEADWEMRKETEMARRYAEYFRDYFAKNGVKKPILVGHSMGTLVGSAILANFPEIVAEKVVFLSPIAERPTALVRGTSVLAAYLPQRMIDVITTRFLITVQEKGAFRQILEKVHQCSLEQRPRRGLIKQAVRFSSGTTVGVELTRIPESFKGNFEVALIAGEEDKLIARSATEKLANYLNKKDNFVAKCQFLPKTGHVHNYEQPQETVRAILDFLAE